jgi:hypothetical protein
MSTGYIVIQEWMTQDLQLSKNELLVYALIYGFSQDGESEFFGSRAYIGKWFNMSLPTVDKSLNNLVDKGLIERRISIVNGVKFNHYSVILPPVKKLYPGSKETLPPGSKETLPNNISNIKDNKKDSNIQNNFLGSISKEKQSSSNLYTKCISIIDSYTQNVAVRNELVRYLNLRLEMKDKPLYTNQWKGLLNKLTDIIKQGNLSPQQTVLVIQQSIERGYASFFPLNTGYGKGKNTFSEGTGISSESATEEDLTRIRDELASQGKRTSF